MNQSPYPDSPSGSVELRNFRLYTLQIHLLQMLYMLRCNHMQTGHPVHTEVVPAYVPLLLYILSKMLSFHDSPVHIHLPVQGLPRSHSMVIAMILKKYTSVDIGKGLLASDILFTIAGFFVFDIKTGLYSLLGLTMRSTLIDSLIESLNRSKYFHVVCSEPEPICEFIKNDLKRGATIVLAQGAFTGDDKYIILTVLSPNEAIKLRNFIKAHTTGAFLLISNTSEIIGKGFHSV